MPTHLLSTCLFMKEKKDPEKEEQKKNLLIIWWKTFDSFCESPHSSNGSKGHLTSKATVCKESMLTVAPVASLPAWQITSSHWEIVLVGGRSGSWGMRHPAHYTAGPPPSGKLMSPPRDDDTQRAVTYDVCTNSKHTGRRCCSFWLVYVGHMLCAAARTGGTFVTRARGKTQTKPLRWVVTRHTHVSANRITLSCLIFVSQRC